MSNVTLHGSIHLKNQLNGIVNSESQISGTFNNAVVQVEKQNIISKNNIYEFPNIGNSTFIYIDKSKNKTYRWDEENVKYFCIGSDYEEIKIIDGGSSDTNRAVSETQ